MLRAYGPDCEGQLIDAGAAAPTIPPGATWIDLDEPTRAEELLVERCVGVQVPTREDMSEIEPSSRLYEQNGTLYMTLSALCGVEEGRPGSEPIGFVLTADRLVTVRYATPKPIRAIQHHARRDPALVQDHLAAFYSLLDAIIDRLADELEEVGVEIERISAHIFAERSDVRRIPARRLTALLTRIGRAQTLLAKVRETAVSTARLLSFLSGSAQLKADRAGAIADRIASLATDVHSLVDHSSFLNDNLTFLLDASLGLISIEQNAAMKVFSWVAVVLMPPTLIAGIFGMNFRHMPELEWTYGYPLAIALIVTSAILPFWILKRLGWI
ncbi:MAG TPA: magnesium transporter CorA family protein [Sphingomicrobium sp.]|nr:magnesium transporter CorA family protein [Sphingomicrobium sp.]